MSRDIGFMATIYYIDGYNVLHKSSELRPLARQDLETAREALIDKVAVYCAATGSRVHLVFDGRGQHQPEKVAHHRGVDGLEIIYSPAGLTADAYIERAVYKAAHRLSLVVVSNDRGLRDLCRNMGALTMEADSFIETVREAGRDTSERAAGTHRDSNPAHLEERLDPATVARLEQLKNLLKKK